MPFKIVELNDVQELVVRPIAMAAIQEFLPVLGIDIEKVSFYGDVIQGMQDGTSLGDHEDKPGFSSSNKVSIEVNDLYDEDGLYVAGYNSNDERNIFFDPETGIRMTTQYISSMLQISVKYRARSKNDMDAWRNQCRNALEYDNVGLVHRPQFTYTIPDDALATIYLLHKQMDPIVAESLGSYLKRNFHSQVGVLHNVVGKNGIFAVNEGQSGVTGTIDFIDVPEAEAGNGATWSVNFNYNVRYRKPVSVKLDYPLVVNNSLIPLKLRPRKDLNLMLPFEQNLTKIYLDEQLEYNTPVPIRMGTYRIPSYDSWKINDIPKFMSSALNVLLSVGDDPTEVCRLDDLGDLTFNPEVLAYLYEIGKLGFNYGYTPILITLHAGNSVLPHGDLYWDNGMIRTTRPMSKRNVYHLNVAIMTDLSRLTGVNLATLLKHPKAARCFLECLEPDLHRQGLLPEGDELNLQDWLDAVDYIKSTIPSYNSRGILERTRVAFLTVTTKRK